MVTCLTEVGYAESAENSRWWPVSHRRRDPPPRQTCLAEHHWADRDRMTTVPCERLWPPRGCALEHPERSEVRDQS